MAKKKKPSRKSSKPTRGGKPRAPRASDLPDPRALEGLMREFLGGLTGGADAPETPAGRAQEIVDEAYESTDPDEQSAMARKALELDPDCADAYVLLAENAPGRKEALELYRRGVEAGARSIGPELFREAEEEGMFWGLLETRPYLRARLGLADTLWTLGRRPEAVEELQEILRLNPNDNQGVRYTLAAWLLDLGRDDDLARLLDRYGDEHSAVWAYSRALAAFRRHGDTPEARKLWQQARKINPHVPDFLLGRRPLPRQQPPYYSPGDPNEAMYYAGTSLAAWRATSGALTWLKEREDGEKPKKKSGPKAKAKVKGKGPTAAARKRLAALPQGPDVWQADSRQLAQWVEVDGEPVRPWMVLVTSRSDDLILAHDLAEEEPSPALLWDGLARAMQSPMAGEPHRPAAIQLRAGGPWESLIPHLEALGVAVEAVESLDQLDVVFEGLNENLRGNAPPGLLEMPGVGPEQVAGFYRAAAEFYRKAPWRRVGYEQAIKVACDRYQSGPWYAILMGQSGLTIGLALYDDLSTLQRLRTSDLSDEENARETVALTVTFDMEDEVLAPDLEAARRHGWEVAGPEAYPSIFRKERGMTMRPPLAWELNLMEACLRALPEFVDRHPPDDPAPRTITVPTASGPTDLVLSWAGD